ncbi:tripartite tricarboxylate transporter TctB family protein [Halomonas sp. A40-4]|uniref:tripartite tricarboxylate transporter TctB family protein n=1 Tax=Halomonas sp. A40-4 TaxID=2785909 RepID=UPI0018F00E11|nr:tripartite tricarboxylate transporter TctB family protein [Halomonas sp. A40-4]QPL47103.1 tripartite tricarboxylate transporter TctB family protein [Halomonas sp. A40-4]
MIMRLNTDIAAGALGLTFGAALWFPRADIGRLSIIFPRAVLLILTLISVALIVKGFVKPSGRQVEITGSPLRLVTVIIGFFLWWGLVDLLGFLLTTLIAFFALTWYLARVETVVSWQRMLKWSPIIVVLVGVFYLTFTEVLNVRLPTGLFF